MIDFHCSSGTLKLRSVTARLPNAGNAPEGKVAARSQQKMGTRRQNPKKLR